MAYSINFNYSESSYLTNEIHFIKKEEISGALFLFPNVYNDSSHNYFDLLGNNERVSIYPVFGVRYGSGSFETFQDETPSDLLWITPGFEIDFIQPISISFFDTGISLQGWARFNKHSAYGFNGNIPNKDLILFEYNPDYSFEFYANSQTPDNGIDFDEGEGAISLNSPWLDIIFGKFRSNIGPFLGGNLSISNKAPGFPQIQLRTKSDKIDFTFIIGELYSGLFSEVQTRTGTASIKRKRYIINHRIDYKIKKNFRVGLYEQVIVGDNLSLSYMIPVIPFWSAQHSLGDTDNLQIGFDMEYVKSKNRFYMALIIDEWAPYDTFNSDHHNWFGGQFGYSRLISDRSLFKIEYTKIEPQVYTHDIDINEPFHYNYPIGFWSGGDSEDIFLKIVFKLKKMKDLEFDFRHTNIGSPGYDTDADFLSGNIQSRSILSLKMSKKVQTNIGPINCMARVQRINTKNLYDIESFMDCQISLLYNINY